MINHILFDFDGTLADTSEGIIKSMHYAFEKMHYSLVTDMEIKNVIGPPLEEMLKILLGTEDSKIIKDGKKYFRERYRIEGVKEVCLYPDVISTLENLKKSGRSLYIVTSKPEIFVHTILDTYNIKDYFTAITGVSETSGSKSKMERMKALIEQYSLPQKQTIMVGDRKEDITAANANQIQSIGVSYGFGSCSSLKIEGCTKIIDSFSALVHEVSLL